MNLSEPAVSICPPGMAAVLRVLAGTDSPLRMRRIAKLAGVSHSAAAVTLGRLAASGIVDIQRATGNYVSWLDMSAKEIRRAARRGEPIVEQILGEGVRLASRDLRDVLRDAVNHPLACENT